MPTLPYCCNICKQNANKYPVQTHVFIHIRLDLHYSYAFFWVTCLVKGQFCQSGFEISYTSPKRMIQVLSAVLESWVLSRVLNDWSNLSCRFFEIGSWGSNAKALSPKMWSFVPVMVVRRLESDGLRRRAGVDVRRGLWGFEGGKAISDSVG